MTAEKFIQSFESHRPEDRGFCRLSSISTENDSTTNNIGFWFEIIRTDGKVMLLTVQSDYCGRKPFRKTFVICGKAQLETFVDKLRLRAQDELSSFLFCPNRYKGYIHSESLCRCKKDV